MKGVFGEFPHIRIDSKKQNFLEYAAPFKIIYDVGYFKMRRYIINIRAECIMIPYKCDISWSLRDYNFMGHYSGVYIESRRY